MPKYSIHSLENPIEKAPMKKRILTLFLLTIATISTASAATCQDRDYNTDDEYLRAEKALFQKTGKLPASKSIPTDAKKLNCSEIRTKRELVANLANLELKRGLKNRDFAKTTIEVYSIVAFDSIRGTISAPTLLSLAKYGSDKKLEQPQKSDKDDSVLIKIINDNVAQVIIHYCQGITLNHCANN